MRFLIIDWVYLKTICDTTAVKDQALITSRKISTVKQNASVLGAQTFSTPGSPSHLAAWLHYLAHGANEATVIFLLPICAS